MNTGTSALVHWAASSFLHFLFNSAGPESLSVFTFTLYYPSLCLYLQHGILLLFLFYFSLSFSLAHSRMRTRKTPLLKINKKLLQLVISWPGLMLWPALN